jgi:hypothetical protein
MPFDLGRGGIMARSGGFGTLRVVTRGRVGAAGLAVWFGGMLAVGAGLLSRHLVALPGPPNGAKLASSMGELRRPETRGAWMAVHVLYSECRCSQRIVDHLLSTARPTGWAEVVLWVGRHEPAPDLSRRFDLRRVDASDLARMGVEATPMLITVDPGGRVRYAGGYTDRKQGPVIDDARIFEASRRADLTAALPIFGCAVSDRLRGELALLPAL